MFNLVQDIPDATDFIVETRFNINTFFRALERASRREQVLIRHDLFLALDSGCRVEEVAVLPALCAASVVDATTFQAHQRDIARLRALMVFTAEDSLEEPSRKSLLAALEGMSSLHFARTQRLLEQAQARGQIDAGALGLKMQDCAARRRGGECVATEREDEEADPVGLPPR